MKATPQSNGARYNFSTAIPEEYEEITLRAVPCTPHLLFIYWNLPEHVREQSRKLLLRVSLHHSTPAVSGSSIEMELAPGICSRYCQIPFPGLSYHIELGQVHSNGSYHEIRSIGRQAPPATPSIESEYRSSSPENSGSFDALENTPAGRGTGLIFRESPETTLRPCLPSSGSNPGS